MKRITSQKTVRNRVELLAPAGDYECFMAALNAGADAVYLGGEKFGARAYAGNFSQDEIIDALNVAHLFGRRVYLTVNTLVKENELSEIAPYILPLYEAGLDGVIVQDIGVMRTIRESFPELPIHASTQMTVTGAYGAKFLEKMGVCRVVPARELSLEEIKSIKANTGLEVECFIHGAMCYAYSGQCLFSSIIGGRSGNRGRCAGPCRLPYNGAYPLSLKDMYTLPILPKLIDSGIDSFKIEGRMKKPEYVAGVTAVYRKYIDKYYALLENGQGCEAFNIEEADERLLRELYIRSDVCGGYYERHNGRDMVTLGAPGYSGSKKETLEDLREEYVDRKPRILVKGEAHIFAGKPISLTLRAGRKSVTVEGAKVQEAKKMPLDAVELSRRLSKLGDTYFSMSKLIVHMDDMSFVSVKELNGLRRAACEMLQAKLLKPYMRKARQNGTSIYTADPEKNEKKACKDNKLAVLVSTLGQLEAALLFEELGLIYVNADIFLQNEGALSLVENSAAKGSRELLLALPHILRKRSYKYLDKYRALLESGVFSGVLVRNFEETEWLNRIGYQGERVSDAGLYAWNSASLAELSQHFDRVTFPAELNRRELSMLQGGVDTELLAYGRLPLMYSANCVRNTLEKCNASCNATCIAACIDDHDGQQIYELTDRYGNIFPVAQVCRHCYNILYNCVPLSLHTSLDEIRNKGFCVLRLDFTVEDSAQTKEAIGFYLKMLRGESAEDCKFINAFTNGHYKRGVE